MTDLDALLHIRRDKRHPVQGKVLISNPLLDDFFFKRSVVLLLDHSSDGSFGLIINKPIEIMLSDITTSFSGFDSHLQLGGPVKSDGVFFMHRFGDILPGSIDITPGLWYGGDVEILADILSESYSSNADMIRFYLGYSGWSPEQLDHEMKEKSWVLADITPEEVTGAKNNNLWQEKVKSLGKEYEPWLMVPIDPSQN